MADTSFNPPIASPAYELGAGPLVLIDGGHFNFHTAEGRYLPFSRLVERDGYVVRPSSVKFTPEMLEGVAILVVSNALSERNADDWSLPTPSAFDSAEIRAVREWVGQGGSLLLIADHMPFPRAAADLAAAFGLLFENGFATGPGRNWGPIVFRRSDGSLADHPITNGRAPPERVDSVASFTGQAFRATAPSDHLMTLPATTVLLLPERAWQFSESTRSIQAGGMLQGAVLRYGDGRVAAFGEAAMFSAQASGLTRTPMGMNAPVAAQNPQFLLNLLHWLSGLLDQSHY